MNLEALLPVAFLAGFFGSGHCLGMCGPVVVLFETANRTGAGGAWRRVAYNTGRLFFYALLGAVAGGVGMVLTQAAGVDAGLAVLRILAAALVVALGLNLLLDLQILRHLETGGAVLWRKLSPLARHVLPMNTLPRALGAGMLWGALPCGLVYGTVAIAATSGTAPGGAAVMLAFWLGTLPALLAAGASAQKLERWSRKPSLRRFTGATLVLVGAFALAMPYLHMGHGSGGEAGDGHAHHAGSPGTLESP